MTMMDNDFDGGEEGDEMDSLDGPLFVDKAAMQVAAIAAEAGGMTASAIDAVDFGQSPLKEDGAGLRLLTQLGPDDKPLLPLPPDTKSDVVYGTKHEHRCSLCNSPWRTRSEHVYIEHKQKPSAVVHFFAKYIGAKVSWEAVKTHMTEHCRMQNIGMSGLAHIARRGDEVALWKYREKDLVIDSLLVEIDDVRGIDCARNPELMLKRAGTMERLTTRLNTVVKERDEAGSNGVNVFQILMDVHDALQHDECRKVIRDKVKAIRDRLSDAA